ncbi:hypothetical protein L1887_24159 [Cichorium endivia]|nr:hypothetical protein L1887_24159 [Cichorium endivia]
MSSSDSEVIVLTSSDGTTFEVAQAVFSESQTIQNIIENGCAGNIIPLSNVTSNILAKVIEYCMKHTETPNTKSFDTKFVEVDQDTLFDLMVICTLQAAIDKMKGKSPEEVRELFNINKDLAEIYSENAWAFE